MLCEVKDSIKFHEQKRLKSAFRHKKTVNHSIRCIMRISNEYSNAWLHTYIITKHRSRTLCALHYRVLNSSEQRLTG